MLLNPDELVLPPVKIPDDMAAHEKAAIRSLADLVTQCTAFSPDARPSVAEILQVTPRNPGTLKFQQMGSADASPSVARDPSGGAASCAFSSCLLLPEAASGKRLEDFAGYWVQKTRPSLKLLSPPVVRAHAAAQLQPPADIRSSTHSNLSSIPCAADAGDFN